MGTPTLENPEIAGKTRKYGFSRKIIIPVSYFNPFQAEGNLNQQISSIFWREHPAFRSTRLPRYIL
jgi:hypothetical protein